jgi:hypothetical protein
MLKTQLHVVFLPLSLWVDSDDLVLSLVASEQQPPHWQQ